MTHANIPPHIQYFFNPDFYPHPTQCIKLIQTHISWVFLTGDYAYKIKKPVDLGFLDFSSLKQRLQACSDELRLNQRLTFGVYLDVIPISKDGKQFTLGGEKDIIDYCLKMRQFKQSDIFDQRLVSQQFYPLWMDALAHTMAGFHHSQKAIFDPAWGDPKSLWQHMKNSLETARNHPEIGFNEEKVAKLHKRSQKYHGKYQNMLKKRQHQGKIKDCHGDLHLQNIALIDGKPTPFDCIEFNDQYRIIDVLNDIAFLVMDCDAKHRPDLGFRFLSQYLEHTGDYEGLPLLPLYLSYRAGVRGKVACLRTNEGSKQHNKDALHYFQLASRYLKPSHPRLFAIGGLSGSGKSHLALLGCGIERAIIIRSDATRKRIAKDFPQHQLYSKTMHELTYQTMFNDAKTALLAGFSVILDATFLHPTSRQQTFELADELDIPLTFSWLDIDHKTLRNRITQRQKEGNDISDADLSVLDMQITEYQRPQEADIRFISDSDHWSDSSLI